MIFFESYTKTFDYESRSTRSEYNVFWLVWTLISLALVGVYVLSIFFVSPEIFISALSLISCLLSLIPSISLTIRRLHDIGVSGWFMLLMFVPIINFFFWLYISFKDSQPGHNEYGPNPKGVGNETLPKKKKAKIKAIV